MVIAKKSLCESNLYPAYPCACAHGTKYSSVIHWWLCNSMVNLRAGKNCHTLLLLCLSFSILRFNTIPVHEKKNYGDHSSFLIISRGENYDMRQCSRRISLYEFTGVQKNKKNPSSKSVILSLNQLTKIYKTEQYYKINSAVQENWWQHTNIPTSLGHRVLMISHFWSRIRPGSSSPS